MAFVIQGVGGRLARDQRNPVRIPATKSPLLAELAHYQPFNYGRDVPLIALLAKILPHNKATPVYRTMPPYTGQVLTSSFPS